MKVTPLPTAADTHPPGEAPEPPLDTRHLLRAVVALATAGLRARGRSPAGRPAPDAEGTRRAAPAQ